MTIGKQTKYSYPLYKTRKSPNPALNAIPGRTAGREHSQNHILTEHRTCDKNILVKFTSCFKANPLARISCVPASFLILVILLTPLGCSSRPMRPSSLLKTTIDMVAEDHVNTMQSLMKELTIKLYRRNPCELAKAPGKTITIRCASLFGDNAPEEFMELDRRRSIDAMLLCFDEKFAGDRVFALMAGLRDMIWASYNKKKTFYFYNMLEPQPLYDSARNIEILIWRLNHRLKSNGSLFLLTNETHAADPNLSFERLFGKMIAHQDLLATIIADRTNRSFVTVSYRLATAAFIPIGM